MTEPNRDPDCALCVEDFDPPEDAVVFEIAPTASTLDMLVGGLPRYATSHERASGEWKNFRPPRLIPISHPWVCRYSPSALLYFDGNSCNLVKTSTEWIFGTQDQSVGFNIGCIRPAHLGVIRALCEAYHTTHELDYAIGLIQNNARKTLAALLADVVQVAFSDEPHNETLALNEGWCERANTVLHDRSILVGPSNDPLNIASTNSMTEALQKLSTQDSDPTTDGRAKQMLFHSCGDGSATFFHKLRLWNSAGIDISNPQWTKTYANNRYDALATAEKENAYIMTERSTYLVAKDEGLVPGLRCFVEEEPVLVAPCSALVHRMAVESNTAREARKFAEWLGSEEAQAVVREYGRALSYARPLYTVAGETEFAVGERLKGRL